jgi:hypothetical protein
MESKWIKKKIIRLRKCRSKRKKTIGFLDRWKLIPGLLASMIVDCLHLPIIVLPWRGSADMTDFLLYSYLTLSRSLQTFFNIYTKFSSLIDQTRLCRYEPFIIDKYQLWQSSPSKYLILLAFVMTLTMTLTNLQDLTNRSWLS